MRAKIIIRGIVQGVGFRPFVYRNAVRNGLVGYVLNRGDAGVEIVVEGKEKNILRFLDNLEKKRPPLSRIYELLTDFDEDRDEFEKFSIIKSSGEVGFSGSVIPPDVSICEECSKELHDPKNRRHNYFFITCTDCGPRYTIIEELPFDRANTTMRAFHICEFCYSEYTDSSNRRFHAQTIACSNCGPKAYLCTSKGQPMEHQEPIREAGRLLEEGYIVAIKGNGGFHIATSSTESRPVIRLRKTKHRTQKPFAIMARDIKTIRSFAELSEKETELLTSYIRPITLLRKSSNYYLSELISPNLHNVGVMLPYTGLHELLFDKVDEPAFVMTSANPPNEPIIMKNNEALKKLGSVVDFFLLHDRVIAKRCDDSVIRLHGKDQSIIRRSRGYAPEPVRLKNPVNGCAIGVGAELNVTSCVLLKDKAFLSQHVGDVEKLETLKFLKGTIEHLTKLTNSRIEIIGCDLHPKFNTTRLAHKLGSNLDCVVTPVQHHHAHMVSLMGEHGVPEMVGIVCDGFGYGLDGNAWGGEILFGDPEGVQRLAHLQEHPMVGGDLATRHPLRMAAGILYGIIDVEEWLLANINNFQYGKKEAEIILQQLKKQITPKTTSCGRVLDSVSALLGICHERTYEGEPAMKLESVALRGKDVLNLAPKLEGRTLDTTTLVHEIFTRIGKNSVADLACSAQTYLAMGLAQLAITEAEQLNVNTIGFSGGVAYNEYITQTIKKEIERNGFEFLVHSNVPPGDGGIAFGQAIVAALSVP